MENLEVADPSSETTFISADKGLFYRNAVEYWSHIPPTVDGMLGGFGFISQIDIQGSSQFMKSLFKLKLPPGRTSALDCGAGIGRITKNLLFNFFEKVDLVEQNPDFVGQAQSSFGSHPKMGLQDFIPEPNSYDVIWCQWVLSQLTDDDLIMFLHACKRGLKTNGIIVLKENISSNKKVIEDKEDSSVTRPLRHLCRVVEQAGLQRIKQRRQKKLPDILFPVYMIAARPVSVNCEDAEEPTSACGSLLTDIVAHEHSPPHCLKENSQEPCILVQDSNTITALSETSQMIGVKVTDSVHSSAPSISSMTELQDGSLPKDTLNNVASTVQECISGSFDSQSASVCYGSNELPSNQLAEFKPQQECLHPKVFTS